MAAKAATPRPHRWMKQGELVPEEVRALAVQDRDRIPCSLDVHPGGMRRDDLALNELLSKADRFLIRGDLGPSQSPSTSPRPGEPGPSRASDVSRELPVTEPAPKGARRAEPVHASELVEVAPTVELALLEAGRAQRSDAPAEAALPPEAEKRLREVFELCDKNSDGHMNKRELILACRKDPSIAEFFKLSINIRQEDGTRDAMEALFQSIDENSDREVSWEELKAFYARKQAGVPATQGTGDGEQLSLRGG